MDDGLQYLATQDAFLLHNLCHPSATLHYLITQLPSLTLIIHRYDAVLRSIVSNITDISLDKTTWT